MNVCLIGCERSRVRARPHTDEPAGCNGEEERGSEGSRQEVPRFPWDNLPEADIQLRLEKVAGRGNIG